MTTTILDFYPEWKKEGEDNKNSIIEKFIQNLKSSFKEDYNKINSNFTDLLVKMNCDFPDGSEEQ